MKVIAVVSAKGGVGKTTLAANLASVLATSGRRVIALDLDPQNALRLHFGVPLDSIDGLSRATLSGDAWQSIMFDGVECHSLGLRCSTAVEPQVIGEIP